MRGLRVGECEWVSEIGDGENVKVVENEAITFGVPLEQTTRKEK